MEIKALKTHIIQPKESLLSILDTYIPLLEENTILAVTSKIISLCENRLLKKEEVNSKLDLIRKEADAILENSSSTSALTLKNNILIPAAGIDESNSNGCYILYPLEIQKTALLIWTHLRNHHKIKNFGVIITDSHTTPLRKGVVGITLGWCGFLPLYNYIGAPDLFKRPLQMTQINILDALAASAVFVMGEGQEKTPLALMKNIPKIEFVDRAPTYDEEKSITIPLKEDIYAPLLTHVAWTWLKDSSSY